MITPQVVVDHAPIGARDVDEKVSFQIPSP
jgi:hypothetical protein